MARLLAIGLAAVALGTTAMAGSRAQNDATADRARAELSAALAGRTAGKAQNCIDQSRVQGPEAIGDRTVIYRQSGRRIWLSTLQSSCPALRGDRTLIVESYGLQICRQDRFQVLPRGSAIPLGFCYFGPFTPYDRDPAPKR